MKKKLRIWMNRRSKMQIIALGFLCLILFGTFLLMMPFSARSGEDRKSTRLNSSHP